MISKEELIERINELPETDQLIMSLKYVDGLSFAEIGEVLDLSAEHVTRMHNYAREYLLRN